MTISGGLCDGGQITTPGTVELAETPAPKPNDGATKGEEGMKEREPVPGDPLPTSIYVLWVAAIVVLAGLGVIGLLEL